MTQERLKELFTYRTDGFFVSKIYRAKGIVKAGQLMVGAVNKHNGYRSLSIDDRKRSYHRAIFLWHHGFLPEFLDHINRSRADNRIENLRPVTRSQNMANMEKQSKISPYKGISLVPRINKYISHIRKDGILIHIGYFHSPEEAARAYDKKAKELFGEFACLNFP